MVLTPQEYHKLTSYQRNQMSQYSLDWRNQPSTFKTYPSIELILLSREVQHDNEKLSKMTEAVHVVTAIRGGASLIHGIQMRNVSEKLSM